MTDEIIADHRFVLLTANGGIPLVYRRRICASCANIWRIFFTQDGFARSGAGSSCYRMDLTMAAVSAYSMQRRKKTMVRALFCCLVSLAT